MNLAQLLNGVALGALLMILSSGLAMIYGLRGVMNFSHGALYMLGAYLAYAVTTKTSFWLALIIAPLGLAVVGAALELGFFRRLQNRSHIEVGLVTFGLALVIDRVIVLIWGDDTYPVQAPEAVSGTTSVSRDGLPDLPAADHRHRRRYGLGAGAVAEPLEDRALHPRGVARHRDVVDPRRQHRPGEPRRRLRSARRSPGSPARWRRRTSPSSPAWARRS